MSNALSDKIFTATVADAGTVDATIIPLGSTTPTQMRYKYALAGMQLKAGDRCYVIPISGTYVLLGGAVEGGGGGGLPTGGAEGQIPVKRSGTDYDAAWEYPQYPRRNWIDNGYFIGGGSQKGAGILPINQRGLAEYGLNNAVGIDRWRGVNALVSLTATAGALHVQLGNGGSFRQRLLQNLTQPMQAGQTFTFSMLCKLNQNAGTEAGGYSLRFWISENRAAVLQSPGGYVAGNSYELLTWTFTAPRDIAAPAIELITASTSADVLVDMDIKAVKLELGGYQTLAHKESGAWVLNGVPDFGEELAACQRYALKCSAYSRLRAALVGAITLVFNIPTPSSMLSLPNNGIIGTPIVEALDSTVQTGFSFYIMSTSPNGIALAATKADGSAHGLTDATLRLNSILLTSEL